MGTIRVFTNGFPETKIYWKRSDTISLLHGLIHAKERFRFMGYTNQECANCGTSRWQIVTQYSQFMVFFLLPIPWFHTRFLVCTGCLGLSGADERLKPLIEEFIQTSKLLIRDLTQQIDAHWQAHFRINDDDLARLASFELQGGHLEDLVAPTSLPKADTHDENMIHCPNCGKWILKDSKFCYKCGLKLSD